MSTKMSFNICNNIKEICPVEKIQHVNNELSIFIKTTHVLNVLLILKHHIHYQFDILTCISCVDYPFFKYRFMLTYDFLSLRYNYRIKVKTFINELTSVNSCCAIFFPALWYESEIWNLFGVFFSNHPNLTKLLTDYGFDGYPLRKDFPLNGFLEIKYDKKKAKIVYELSNLKQTVKKNFFSSPWEEEYNDIKNLQKL